MKPENLHPAERRRQMRRRDAAFGGFLYIGWMLASGVLLRWVPATLPGYWHAGSFLAYPALVLAVPAALVALAYSVVVRHQRSLWVLASLVLAAGPVLVSIRVLGTPWGSVAEAFFIALTVLAVALPLRWFLSRRRRWSRLSESEARSELDRGW